MSFNFQAAACFSALGERRLGNPGLDFWLQRQDEMGEERGRERAVAAITNTSTRDNGCARSTAG